MSVPHKKKPKKKDPPWVTNTPCKRCGELLEEGDLDEDNELCMGCQQDDADYIDSTMELD
jgi:formylmethanofuran dehydrogenase subunit E